MANEKTINLAGSEVEVKISGQNCDIRNDGTDIVYASRKANVVGGADGVVSIPAGQAVKLLDSNGAVYLLGTGSVQLCGNDYGYPVFKCAATSSGEGGVDEQARIAINAHAGSTDIHLTAEDVAELASNPNLLINPNFEINQRGAESYTTGFTADCWQTQTGFEVKPTADGIIIAPTAKVTSNLFGLREFIPFDRSLIGKSMTFSTEVTQTHDYAYCAIAAYNGNDVIKTAPKVKLEVGVNSVTIDAIPENTTGIVAQYTINAGADVGDVLKAVWGKTEIGANATAYCPPDPATELMRCQRYYQLRTTGDIDPADLRPAMATITDIKERSDGLYEYIAAD